VRHALSSFALLFSVSVSLLASGCSSAPARDPSRDTIAGTGLTVVGWSLRDQAPIPVRGVVRQGGETVLQFDTQAQPAGKTFSIPPGSYQVEVTHRLAGDRIVAASGLERADIRPGENVRCEVVVDDREAAEPLPATESSR